MHRPHRKIRRPTITAAALLPLASAAAVAQVRPDSAARDSAGQRVAPVVVTGKRTPVTVGGASAVVVEVDSMRLSAAPVMEEALRALPFVLLRRNSRGESELSVRGSDSRQAAVLVDGVPITLGWDHRADPSLVPLTGARTLTVTRGLSSLLHGPNVLGGVIEVGVTQGADTGRRP
ncbi:MAG TPA: TonB-dependent receptor plug domain-containing protein, partial [Gemmatimonadaceae bacterium]|nr:TonB-dependent receptor plug domain-containing protein [Gemmatimonadaceae bacterium]